MRPETFAAPVEEVSDAMVWEAPSPNPFAVAICRRTAETTMAGNLKTPKDSRAQLLSHGLSGVQDKHYDKGKRLRRKGQVLAVWNGFLAGPPIGTLPLDDVYKLPPQEAANEGAADTPFRVEDGAGRRNCMNRDGVRRDAQQDGAGRDVEL
jgi:hypothetical protein